jgi:hypothetical protein
MSQELYTYVLTDLERPCIAFLNDKFKNKYLFTHSTVYEDQNYHIDCYCKDLKTGNITSYDFKFLGYRGYPYNKETLYAELYKDGRELSLFGKQDYFWYFFKNKPYSYIINRKELQTYIENGLKNNSLKITVGPSGSDLVYFNPTILPKNMCHKSNIVFNP